VTASLQLFSLFPAFQADGWESTLRRLAKVGFTAVEPFALHATGDEVARLQDELGLTAPTAHGFLDADLVDATLASAAALGVGTVYQPDFAPKHWEDLDAARRTAAVLVAASERARDLGIRVGVHHHDVELLMRIGGRPAFDVVVDLLPPDVVVEYDVYWSTLAGLDVAAEITRWGDRVGALHLKDGRIADGSPQQCALGEGIIALEAAIAAVPTDTPLVVSLDRMTGEPEQLWTAVTTSRAWLNERGIK